MTKTIVLDTETTGLIQKRGRGFDNFCEYTNLAVYNNCRMLSICYKVFDDKENPLLTKYFVIKPKDFIVDNNSEAIKINGLTTDILEKGVDIEEVFRQLNDDLEDVSLIVCHNVAFDTRIISSELHRYDYNDLLGKFRSIPTYCTCLKGELITKIKPKNWKNYKVPKLCELYHHLFKEQFEGSHNAENDVNACARCYFKMKDMVVT